LKSRIFSRLSSRAIARLTPGGDIPINSDAAANVPASTTAANTLIPLEIFPLDDLIGSAFWSFNGRKSFKSNASMARRTRRRDPSNAAGSDHSIQYRGKAAIGWPCVVRQERHYDSLVTVRHLTSVIHVI
jgi:hypothetical protein